MTENAIQQDAQEGIGAFPALVLLGGSVGPVAFPQRQSTPPSRLVVIVVNCWSSAFR
jgi:hypothetical protein